MAIPSAPGGTRMPNGHDDVDADTTLTPSRVRTVGVVQRRVFVSKPLGFIERLDSIAVEEPLEIKVQGPGKSLSISP